MHSPCKREKTAQSRRGALSFARLAFWRVHLSYTQTEQSSILWPRIVSGCRRRLMVWHRLRNADKCEFDSRRWLCEFLGDRAQGGPPCSERGHQVSSILTSPTASGSVSRMVLPHGANVAHPHGCAGSSPVASSVRVFARVAEWLRRLPSKQVHAGSNPAARSLRFAGVMQSADICGLNPRSSRFESER
jgi:hypothetical protein